MKKLALLFSICSILSLNVAQAQDHNMMNDQSRMMSQPKAEQPFPWLVGLIGLVTIGTVAGVVASGTTGSTSTAK